MKPSEQCKLHGLLLTQLSEITKQSQQTLINWHKSKPELFESVVIGASMIAHGKSDTLCHNVDKTG
jgi:hypothetical protein